MKFNNNNSVTGALCSSEQFEEMQIIVEGLQAVLCKVLDRLENVENQLEQMNALVTGGATKSAERAVRLNEAVRQKGFLTRPEASKILNCCHTETLRAMKTAADIFDDLHVIKNHSKRWVLAVVQ